MTRKGIYFAIMALLLCSCSGKTGQQQGEVAEVASRNSLQQDEVADKDSLEVRQRVAAIYDDVFDHYNRMDYDSWSSLAYFSESLNSLWSELPEEEAVVDVSPWMMAQDYDTLACQKVEVISVTKDSAMVDVVVLLSEKWPTNIVRLLLVREQHEETDKADWYIDDFRHEADSYSVVNVIRDYIKNYKHN